MLFFFLNELSCQRQSFVCVQRCQKCMGQLTSRLFFCFRSHWGPSVLRFCHSCSPDPGVSQGPKSPARNGEERNPIWHPCKQNYVSPCLFRRSPRASVEVGPVLRILLRCHLGASTASFTCRLAASFSFYLPGSLPGSFRRCSLALLRWCDDVCIARWGILFPHL